MSSIKHLGHLAGDLAGADRLEPLELEDLGERGGRGVEVLPADTLAVICARTARSLMLSHCAVAIFSACNSGVPELTRVASWWKKVSVSSSFAPLCGFFEIRAWATTHSSNGQVPPPGPAPARARFRARPIHCSHRRRRDDAPVRRCAGLRLHGNLMSRSGRASGTIRRGKSTPAVGRIEPRRPSQVETRFDAR